MNRFLLLVSQLGLVSMLHAQTTLIPYGADAWKYLDNGTNQGTAWYGTSFSDAAWKSGIAPFGYGTGTNPATTVSWGANAKKKYITTYFRRTFSVANPSQYGNFTLNLKRDDGAAVYVNGTRVYLSNMPATYSFSTKASSEILNFSTPVSTTIASSAFSNGLNTLAVEIHQASASGSDIYFDLQLIANPVTNQSPVANAGTDQSITLPTSSVTLSGSGSDADGTIASYAWTKVSGPAAGTISSPAASGTAVTGLTLAGTYAYQLAVTDNNGATGKDTVLIVVNPAPNQSPVANAGTDQSITLPTSSVTLSGSGSDADGTIASYAWAQVSGPATGSIASPSAASTVVSGLTTAGTYVFQLTVTDNAGATATDQVSITVSSAPSGTLTLVNWGDTWRYLDNGTDQGTAWRSSSFNDALWASGTAELGYGDGDEATVLGFGPSSTSKYITSYFRKVVSFSNPGAYSLITLSVKRDDGIVVYINGAEVYRNTMPVGAIAYNTTATAAVSDDGEGIFTADLLPGMFVDGNNTIAVEIHQSGGSSSDISFDMELVAKDGSSAATLTRGPYIQMVNTTAATLRWRTDLPTDSRVDAGTVYGTYPVSASDATLTTEHEVRLTGLLPDTRYYYRFGSSASVLQNASSNYFQTAPTAAVNRKVRVAVFGDCGRNDNSYQTSTLAAYQNYTGANPAEIMLLLGDNAYNSGTDAEYQSNFFNVYSPNILKNHALFPAPGNHDYANSADRQADKNVPYYSNFTMPKNAECGGVASGTECYYSYDWGNIHFLSLDSYGQETGALLRLYDTTGPQVTWIKQDLAANTKKWTVAYWHHPPYTMGSHNSDIEQDLVKMRQNFIRILERYGVDLVLCGHSHDYERSYLLKGYYTNEAGFNLATHAVNGSSGRYDGSANSCAYQTVSGPVNHGTVYVVSGSAGASGGVQAGYPHNALPFAISDGGMFYFEVDDNRLDAKFIQRTGAIYDKFTILKDAGQTATYDISQGQSVTLTASWKGTYSWSNGQTTRSITVSPLASTNYTCTDGVTNCVSDQYAVNVLPVTGSKTVVRAGTINSPQAAGSLQTYPVPVRRGNPLFVRVMDGQAMEFTLVNMAGQQVMQSRIQGQGTINTETLKAGVYLIRGQGATGPVTRKILVTER